MTSIGSVSLRTGASSKEILELVPFHPENGDPELRIIIKYPLNYPTREGFMYRETDVSLGIAEATALRDFLDHRREAVSLPEPKGKGEISLHRHRIIENAVVIPAYQITVSKISIVPGKAPFKAITSANMATCQTVADYIHRWMEGLGIAEPGDKLADDLADEVARLKAELLHYHRTYGPPQRADLHSGRGRRPDGTARTIPKEDYR